MAEVFDASPNPSDESQRLINISTRGFVGTGENVLIGGLIVTGNASKRFLLRGAGPSLAAFGVTGTLADPQIALYAGSTLLAQNDNWGIPVAVGPAQSPATAAQVIAAQTQIGTTQFPTGSRDAAVIITLTPGGYTLVASGVAGQTGTALIEIYEIPIN